MSAAWGADYQGNDSAPYSKEEWDESVKYLGERGELAWDIKLKNNKWFRLCATMNQLEELKKENAALKAQMGQVDMTQIRADAELVAKFLEDHGWTQSQVLKFLRTL